MRLALLAFAFCAVAWPDDVVTRMNSGITAYLQRLTAASPATRHPERGKLTSILGVVDARVAPGDLALDATLQQPAERAATPHWRALAVRWPVLEGVAAEGLYFEPRGAVRCHVVALPDADQPPELLLQAQAFAAAGCDVLVPVLIDRRDDYSRGTNLTHREWIYRMAYPVGRHPLGYEVQKTLAAVDWFAARGGPIGVFGVGEGGAVALYAAALDQRIQAAQVLGYFDARENVADEPIYRDLFGLLRDFGDAELATLTRRLIVSPLDAPVVADGRNKAAPGRLKQISPASFYREFARALQLKLGAWLTDSAEPSSLLTELGVAPVSAPIVTIAPASPARMARQFHELEAHVARLVRASEKVRDQLWQQVGPAGVRQRVLEEVIGVLPDAPVPPNVRVFPYKDDPAWTAQRVEFDVRRDVIGVGFLLLPKGLKHGERRPLIVMQHGLSGHAEWLFEANDPQMLATYRNFAATLAARGYIVYVPQAPHSGDFRQIVRLSRPLGLTLFSFIRAQYQQALDWLVTLPQVDAAHIGFYGLSYGGKTALRVPVFDERFQAIACGGDFNEWIRKLTTVEESNSYMFSPEYDVLEWNLAHVASHAELARLAMPRAFLVERGHRDGVGRDEWVSYEFARLRRAYDEAGFADRVSIAFFNGPHRVDGPAVLDFFARFLRGE
jgi:dienelactone hydrolase